MNSVLVFDSGIGGFSILKELKKYDVSLIYYADQANFPYGDKSESWIKTRFAQLESIFSQFKLSGLVIACNSATVSTIFSLRDNLDCPIFGVEPVTKMLKDHQSPVIWGTAVTTNSQVAKNLQARDGSHIRYFVPVGLASAIEHEDSSLITQILQKTKLELGVVDSIGLSCTHYPLIKTKIKNIFPKAKIYDPSTSVAIHIAKTLNLTLNIKPGLAQPITYLSSLDVLRLQQQAKRFGL